MEIINFTVAGGVYASDTTDTTGNVGTVPLMGTVRFIPEMPLYGPAALAPEYVPPAAIVPREFTGVIDTDGVLKNVRGGTAGVRLWSNDPILRLETLVYRVVLDMTDLLGNPVDVQGGTFYAPTYDTVMYLTSLIGIPGVKGVNGRDRWIDGGTPSGTGAEQANGGGI